MHFHTSTIEFGNSIFQSKADGMIQVSIKIIKKKKEDKKTLAFPLATYQHHILHLEAQPCHPELPEK